ncbi:MAG: glycosyltransferase, group 1 family [Candidatus Eremiobacteraeota bacterium]|nr:glycosyltransferase, group 1 family [Candidatus Eremiobacteraeota bacterium]
MKLLVLASAGGDAHRRTLTALVENASLHGDVRVLAPDAEGGLLRPIGVPVESWNPAGLFNVLRSVGALQRAVEHHAPDVIHAVGWTAAAVALGALTPAHAAQTVVTVLDPIRDGDVPKQFVEKRLPELLRRAGYATCAYRTLATDLMERFGIAPERIEVIPPGVVPQLPPASTRPHGRDGPIVGYLSPIDADSAWESAVDALAVLANTRAAAQLWFATEGAPHNAVHAFARARGVHERMRYFDHLPPAEFARGIDVAVVPRGRDGLPYALPQALVDGVPVVATNDDGLADTLAPFSTGWLVPDGADGLVAGVEAVWARIGAAWAGAQAQRLAAIAAFDPARAADHMLGLYARVARLPADEEVKSSQADAKDAG